MCDYLSIKMIYLRLFIFMSLKFWYSHESVMYVDVMLQGCRGRMKAGPNSEHLKTYCS
jgi:hypothetical protein